MSDIAQSGRRSRSAIAPHSIESRLLFGAFYPLFLVRAALKRLAPRRADNRSGPRDSILSEARIATSVMVASSFMGL